MTDLPQHDLDTLAICAVRYALGRRSYVVDDVARIVAELDLSAAAVRIIAEDISDALWADEAGGDADRRAWERCRDRLIERSGEGA